MVTYVPMDSCWDPKLGTHVGSFYSYKNRAWVRYLEITPDIQKTLEERKRSRSPSSSSSSSSPSVSKNGRHAKGRGRKQLPSPQKTNRGEKVVAGPRQDSGGRSRLNAEPPRMHRGCRTDRVRYRRTQSSVSLRERGRPKVYTPYKKASIYDETWKGTRRKRDRRNDRRCRWKNDTSKILTVTREKKSRCNLSPKKTPQTSSSKESISPVQRSFTRKQGEPVSPSNQERRRSRSQGKIEESSSDSD
jgi:hypothetical protein